MFNQNPSLKGGLGCLYIGGRTGFHVLHGRGGTKTRSEHCSRPDSDTPRMSGSHRMSGVVRISGRETTEDSGPGRMSGAPDVRSWPDVRSQARISAWSCVYAFFPMFTLAPCCIPSILARPFILEQDKSVPFRQNHMFIYIRRICQERKYLIIQLTFASSSNWSNCSSDVLIIPPS